MISRKEEVPATIMIIKCTQRRNSTITQTKELMSTISMMIEGIIITKVTTEPLMSQEVAIINNNNHTVVTKEEVEEATKVVTINSKRDIE